MECKSAETLIDGYLDHELDPVRSLEIEDHLRTCSLCSQSYKAHQMFSEILRKRSLYFKAPGDLHRRIQRSVRQAANAETVSRRLSWSWGWVAAPVATAALVILTLVPFSRGPTSEEILTREVLSSHIRSLMPDHLTDIRSSDRHNVKPWFNGKLEFSPTVADLSTEGFPLVGGRLDFLHNRQVAVLVYGRRQHFINLFVWPSPSESDTEIKTILRQGYNLFYWTSGGMTYWTVSDLNKDELQEFARQVQGRTSIKP